MLSDKNLIAIERRSKIWLELGPDDRRRTSKESLLEIVENEYHSQVRLIEEVKALREKLEAQSHPTNMPVVWP